MHIPISPLSHFCGRVRGIRTLTLWILSPLPLPNWATTPFLFFGTDSEIRTHKLLILSQEGIPDSRHISINFFCAKGEIRTPTD